MGVSVEGKLGVMGSLGTGEAGWAGEIKPIPLGAMEARYAKGELSQVVR